MSRSTLYVSKVDNSVHDGKSWETAFNYLNDALDITYNDIDNFYDIWIAKGRYVSKNTTPNSIYRIRNLTCLYG